MPITIEELNYKYGYSNTEEIIKVAQQTPMNINESIEYVMAGFTLEKLDKQKSMAYSVLSFDMFMKLIKENHPCLNLLIY